MGIRLRCRSDQSTATLGFTQQSGEWSPYMLSATLYLMTRYALKPCAMLATLAVQHLRALAELPPQEVSPMLLLRLRSLERVWQDVSQAIPAPLAAQLGSKQLALDGAAGFLTLEGKAGGGEQRCTLPDVESQVELILCLMTEYIFAPSNTLARLIADSLTHVARRRFAAPSLQATAGNLIRQWQSLTQRPTPIDFSQYSTRSML